MHTEVINVIVVMVNTWSLEMLKEIKPYFGHIRNRELVVGLYLSRLELTILLDRFKQLRRGHSKANKFYL